MDLMRLAPRRSGGLLQCLPARVSLIARPALRMPIKAVDNAVIKRK